MPRTARFAPGGMVFHVLNRGVGRMQIFDHHKDYAAFERVIEETLRMAQIRINAFCWMPNHWHLVLWPERDGDLSEFVQRMSNTHTQRWQRAKQRVGCGHLYQARFKSFPVETDDHFYSVVRYVERNALRAGLVPRAEDWPLGQFASARDGQTPTLARRVAPARADRLAAARESTSDRSRTRGDPSLCASRFPMRQHRLGRTDRRTTGAAIHPATPRAPAQEALMGLHSHKQRIFRKLPNICASPL